MPGSTSRSRSEPGANRRPGPLRLGRRIDSGRTRPGHIPPSEAFRYLIPTRKKGSSSLRVGLTAGEKQRPEASRGLRARQMFLPGRIPGEGFSRRGAEAQRGKGRGRRPAALRTAHATPQRPAGTALRAVRAPDQHVNKRPQGATGILAGGLPTVGRDRRARRDFRATKRALTEARQENGRNAEVLKGMQKHGGRRAGSKDRCRSRELRAWRGNRTGTMPVAHRIARLPIGLPLAMRAWKPAVPGKCGPGAPHAACPVPHALCPVS